MGKNQLQTSSRQQHLSGSNKKIALFNDDDLHLHKYSYRLKKAGFTNIVSCKELKLPFTGLLSDEIDLIVLKFGAFSSKKECYSLVSFLRYQGYTGHIAMISEQFEVAEIYALFQCGVSDIWIEGAFFSLPYEVSQLLIRRPCMKNSIINTNRIGEVGILRTAGLSPKEIMLLQIWANGFPRHCDIAVQIGITTTYVYKQFSRIYEKLSETIGVDNSPKLAHLITVCAMY